MNQPNYHFELLISGFGTVLAMVIGAFALWGAVWFPWDIIKGESNSIMVALFFLPLIYTTGIVTDRFTDILLGRWWIKDISQKHFGDDDSAYMRARTIVYARSESIKTVFEYSRTRIRILRCWMLNSLLIGLAALMFIWVSPKAISGSPEEPFCYFVCQNRASLSLVVIVMTVFSVLISFYSWRNMTDAECRNLKYQSKLLEEMNVHK